MGTHLPVGIYNIHSYASFHLCILLMKELNYKLSSTHLQNVVIWMAERAEGGRWVV